MSFPAGWIALAGVEFSGLNVLYSPFREVTPSVLPMVGPLGGPSSGDGPLPSVTPRPCQPARPARTPGR